MVRSRLFSILVCLSIGFTPWVLLLSFVYFRFLYLFTRLRLYHWIATGLYSAVFYLFILTCIIIHYLYPSSYSYLLLYGDFLLSIIKQSLLAPLAWLRISISSWSTLLVFTATQIVPRNCTMALFFLVYFYILSYLTILIYLI